MRRISLADAPARLDDARSAKTATDAIMRVVVDVTHPMHHAEVEALLPGFSDTMAKVASEEGAAHETRITGRMPELAIALHMGDAEKTSVFKCETAVVKGIKLRISKSAKRADLVIAFVGTLTKAEWAAIRESMRADVFAAISLVERVVVVKAKGRKKKKTSVTIVDDRQVTIDDVQKAAALSTIKHCPQCGASGTVSASDFTPGCFTLSWSSGHKDEDVTAENVADAAFRCGDHVDAHEVH